MKKAFTRFARNRRAAITFIFAGSLLPLVMLIGLSIDYSFYVQARSQFGLAADAAAMYSLREASAVYTLESATPGNTTASADAKTKGQNSGVDWFNSQLATLPTATLNGGSPNVIIASTANGNANSAGFNSTVNYSGEYPPFFNGLFHHNTNWSITGTSGATTQYAYLELLVLMDDSGSMLVSADIGNNTTPSTTNPGGILTMDDNSVCIPNAYIDGTAEMNALSSNVFSDPFGSFSSSSLPASQTAVTWSKVQNLTNASSVVETSNSYTSYTPVSPTPICKNGMNQLTYTTTTAVTKNGNTTTTSVQSMTNTNSGPTTSKGVTTTVTSTLNTTPGAPYAPCAFACHTTTATHTIPSSSTAPQLTYSSGSLANTTSGLYTDDLYGLARQLGVLLKTDVVFQSTETMVNILINSEQIPNQFSIGMYSFDNDSCPIVNGTTDGQASLPEATTDLAGALTSIKSYDYTNTPSETQFPPIVTNANGDTNFPLSVSDLIKGTMSCTTTQSPLATPATTSTVGSVATNPEKFVFLVTDGMEDNQAGTTYASGNSGTCGRMLGEMTGIAVEANADTASASTTACDLAVCKPLKDRGYTIYVLYVPYPATQNTYYYRNLLGEDLYTSTDFPALTSTQQTPQVWNEGISGTVTASPVESPSPDVQALQACASTSTDFYTANSSTDISTKMGQMLQSALSSSIRITQ